MTEAVPQQIHAKITQIARQLGNDANHLGVDDNIPASGLIDSAGIMELIFWFEAEYELSIPQQDLTVDNLGTISAMSSYLKRAQNQV